MAGKGRRKGNSELVLSLASGKTIRDAAQQAGLSERTAFRRINDPEFRRQVREARSEMFSRSLGLLADASTSAVGTLRQLSLSAMSESVRLGAAKAILEIGNRVREVNEIEVRLSELEALLEEGNNA